MRFGSLVEEVVTEPTGGGGADEDVYGSEPWIIYLQEGREAAIETIVEMSHEAWIACLGLLAAVALYFAFVVGRRLAKRIKTA